MTHIIGSDEAGFGTWAGDLVVAAVLAPLDWVPPPGLTDSKKLSQVKREALYKALLKDSRIQYRIESIFVEVIDQHGVFTVLKMGHRNVHRSLSQCTTEPCRHIADGNLELGEGIESIPKADDLFPAVSAASILAKVTQVHEMMELDKLHPGYGFASHCGYGTPAHQAALKRLGICDAHRKSYSPIKKYLEEKVPRGDLEGFLPK